ncbi:hypothetical protein GF324_08380, partial [bacterium]|nr:hypothetical protein [bacterium]
MLPATLGVMIPIVALLIGPLIVFIIVWGENKRRQLEHAERLKAMEKGYPIPMEKKKPRARYPFAWPFVFIGLG